MIKLIIPGAPIGKQMPRAQRFGKFIRHYDPQEKEKLRVRQICKEQIDSMLGFSDTLKTPVEINEINKKASKIQLVTTYHVTYVFLLKKNLGASKAIQNEFKWHPAVSIKPDIDNMLKFYNDVLTGLIWIDDKYISKISAIKRYSDNPRTEIEITMIEKPNPDQNQQAIMKTFTPEEFLELTSMINIIASLGPNSPSDEIAIGPEYLAKLIAFCHRYHKEVKKIARHVDENNKEH